MAKKPSLQAQVDALAAEVALLKAVIDGIITTPNRTTGLIPQRTGPRLLGTRKSYSD